MGGVLSAAAVAFGKPAAKQAEVVSTMLRGSIIGGMTLFFTNIIRSAFVVCACVFSRVPASRVASLEAPRLHLLIFS